MIICDLDGTIFDNSHRKHLVECENPNWTEFLKPELVALDPVFPEALQAVEWLRKYTSHNWTFLTGRNESLREVSEKSLKDKAGFSIDNLNHLIMRPADNYETPTVFKEAEIKKIINEMHYPEELLALDDDVYMQAVYLKYGIIPLKAPECWKAICQINKELPPEKYWRL